MRSGRGHRDRPAPGGGVERRDGAGGEAGADANRRARSGRSARGRRARCRRRRHGRGRSGSSPACCRPRGRARRGSARGRRPGEPMPLIRAASGSMALSKASGPSSRPPVIWPRSAILQSAAASMVEGILVVTVSTADRIATAARRGRSPAQRSIAFWTMSRLVSRSGKMLIAASVMKSVSGWPRHVHDEDMADPPLGAEPGRRDGDLAHQLVGVQAALHQELAPALADQRDGLGGGGVAVRRVDDLAAGEIEAVLGRTSRILASGPTSTGSISCSAAASIAPRSEVSSQGWATIVTAGVPSRAAAIRRSYFSVGLGARMPSCRQDASRLASPAPDRGRRARRRGAAARPRHRPARRLASTTLASAAKASRRSSTALGHQAGNRAQRRLLVDEQHQVLLAHQRLEVVERHLPARRVGVAEPADRREAALVRGVARPCRPRGARGPAPREARRGSSRRGARRCDARPAPRAACSAPPCAGAATTRCRCRARPAAPACRRSRGRSPRTGARRPCARRRGPRRSPARRAPARPASGLPAIGGAAAAADALGLGRDPGHPRVPRPEHLVGEPQRVHAAHRLGERRRDHGADRRLGEGAVEREVDLREPGGGLELALVGEVVAAERADVVEGAGLAAHHPFAGDEVGVVDRLALRRQDRLVEAGRQDVDQVDVRGELVVLLPRDAAGDEDAEVADLVVDGVDDGLAPGADVVLAVVEVEDPVERLLRRRDVVALGAEDDDRRADRAQVDRGAVGGADVAGGEAGCRRRARRRSTASPRRSA